MTSTPVHNRRSFTPGLLSVASAVFALGTAGPARANEPPELSPAPSGSGTASVAQVLFEVGKKAMDRGDYDLACTRFRQSHRSDPAVGTLLNLGNCEERRGNLASAFRHYERALHELDTGDPRRDFTEKRLTALAERVPTLTVTLRDDAPPSTHITRNGEPLEELGSPLQLDPGRVVIVAEAEGHQRRVYQLELSVGEDAELSVSAGEPIAAPEPTPRPTPAGPDDDSTLGYVFLGTGMVSAAAATTFGILTYSEYRTVRDHCDVDRGVCFDPVGQRAAKAGATYEALAYVFGSLGLTSLSIGGYLLLRDGAEDEAAGHVSVSFVANGGGPPGLMLDGTF